MNVMITYPMPEDERADRLKRAVSVVRPEWYQKEPGELEVAADAVMPLLQPFSFKYYVEVKPLMNTPEFPRLDDFGIHMTSIGAEGKDWHYVLCAWFYTTLSHMAEWPKNIERLYSSTKRIWMYRNTKVMNLHDEMIFDVPDLRTEPYRLWYPEQRKWMKPDAPRDQGPLG